LSNEVDSLSPAVEPRVPDIYDLTEDMTAAPRDGAGFRTIDGQPDVVFAEPPPAEPAPPEEFAPPEEPAPPPMSALHADRLLSGASLAAVDSAFNSLAQTVLVQNARTLEDLVKEMLRPMLKTWLDDNLPGLVERLVRAEIERVSRGHS
jgi:cell pole-organizing protein PopZ